MKAKPCLPSRPPSPPLPSPGPRDKGDRTHLEDNITQHLAQVCSPTSLHKTMHMNEIFHPALTDFRALCNTKRGDLSVTGVFKVVDAASFFLVFL